jgi:poly [ADP-ribose] polymerase 10/14/15
MLLRAENARLRPAADAEATEERRQRLAAEARAAEAERKLRATEERAAEERRQRVAKEEAERQRRVRAATQNSRDTLPPYWNPIMDRSKARRFVVDPLSDSEEYARVEKAFMLTLDDPTRGLQRTQFTIQSVERIQNMDLWNLYVARRKSVCGRKSPKDAQNLVRTWLFHGGRPDTVDKILQQGFNRSFAGRNATRYGQGSYFARDASYSTFPLYSPPDTDGVQSIFLARVVVGEYTLGVQGALTPAERDATTHALYDSTVDNVRDPSIFVTYNDGQAYPEYLIKFKQDGNPPPPTNCKPAHPDYRPNVFLAAMTKTLLLDKILMRRGLRDAVRMSRRGVGRPCADSGGGTAPGRGFQGSKA